MHRFLPALFCFCFAALTARGLELKETRWGFDGRVVAGCFNIFSVRLAQPGNKPFDGELIFREMRGVQPVGAPIIQPLYLTPGTERWAQFTVLISTESDWTLEWGRSAKERVTIDAPKIAAPATVLLVDSTTPFGAEMRLRAFPEDLFPTSVSATAALDAVVLDHPPRWEAPRREAFLDWIRRGGIVHLIRGGHRVPTFDGDLDPLNTSGARARLGAGWIVRHEITRAECSAEFLAQAGFPTRALKTDAPTIIYGFDQALFRGLAAMTRPKIAWWLIYLLTLAYLAMIGPFHYRWSKLFDWRISLAILGATVSVFAIAFLIAGRRGAGERQLAHSLSVAHALGQRRYDVLQWSSAFVTEGDLYQLTHSAPANFYSATSDIERVNGRILNGRDGHFQVDIPLYSSRPFVHAAVMRGDDTSLEVLRWEPNEILLRPAMEFPRAEETWALWDGKFHPVRQVNRLLKIEPGEFESDFFDAKHLAGVNALQHVDRALEWKKLLRPLIGRALGGAPGMANYSPPRQLPADQLQLFIYAPVPKGFQLQGKGFGEETGKVLYVQHVFKPVSP